MLKFKQILCKNISKSTKLHTGQLNLILKDISFDWRAGEAIGLLGLNGAGKTTLLRLIGKFDLPSTGKIIYSPKNIRVTTVFQRPEDHFIFETVKKQISSHAIRRLDMNELLDIICRIGLPKDILFHSPYSLSSGQQRLVAIASAVAKQADFIILDEPMAGLDASSRNLVSEALKNLKKDKKIGFMLVSHHPDDLFGFVDRLLIIDNKTILYHGYIDTVPLEVLYACLAKTDPSLLLFMKRLANDKNRIDPAAFSTSSRHQMEDMIIEALKR